MNTTPTRQDIEDLKHQWNGDPCWDLEATPGFESVREELLAHSRTMQARWVERNERALQAYAARLGTDNLTLARYVRSLEERLFKLEERVLEE
jgi:hypothetical protein